MVDLLIALQSLDELLRDVCVYPDEVVIVEVVLLVEKFEVEVPVGQTSDNRILCLEHDSEI